VASPTLFEVSKLELPEDIYTRARGSPWWANVYAYAQEMEAGAEFPPILVGEYEERLIVVDGYHRVNACKQLKLSHIQGTLKHYDNLAEIVKDSVKANNHHGVRYTPQDKAHIADLLAKYGLEKEQISELVKVPVDKLERFTVKNIRGKTLKEPLMKLVNDGVLTMEQAVAVDQSRFSTQSVEDVVVQLIGYMEFGAYPWGVDKYASYAQRLVDLITPNL